ncbi:hypothetical protein [Epibacterium ulvae]|uniref:Uncharacterized protein n=1 Tax=Epibacterium ulvae TaxID=1156985 RepID=A0A1G5R3K9_9RHOB|nr:hypothetical protein [Epibacterium ulvae]SCZ68597.1 hypothetical protein SAMN04488118_10833 [Epibacterium ulvae]
MKNFALALAISSLLSTTALAQEYIESQPGPNGVEIHLKQVQLRNNQMTVVLVVENTSDEGIEFAGGDVNDIYVVTSDKKYPVLTDSEGQFVGAPIAQAFDAWFERTQFEDLEPNSTQQSWFKFEAPADSDWPVELALPGVIPFLLEKPES